MLQKAVTALAALTIAKVHVSVSGNNAPMAGLKDCEVHVVSGPHPAGLVGTQINKIDPINKGEVVWTLAAQDLLILGNLLETGVFNASRTFSLGGSVIENPQYFSALIGAELAPILKSAGTTIDNYRLINGDVLTGKTSSADGHLGYKNNSVVALPEGDDYEFFGWTMPALNKVSTTRALTFSWLTPNKGR